MDPDSINLGLLVLRVTVGVVLALHGIAKFRGGIAGVGRWFESEGLRPGKFHAYLAALTEIGAGLGLALGLVTPLSAMAFIGVMTTAGWVGHRTNGFFIIREGWEYVFVLAVAAAALAATGPGEWSLDNALGIDWSGPFYRPNAPADPS